ncbi:tetratricopeptide repeat protein [Dongia sp.]|uniref:tetratricopeptide repeat protein n=1 Tax=Dongia sp. TaxID=1977262 RepID=UPI0035B2C325
MSKASPDQRRFIAAIMTVSAADDMLEEGDRAGAITAYRKAIDVCPPCDERGSFQVLLGTILFEEGDVDAAAEAFHAAAENGCSYPEEALRRLSFARAAKGDYAAAIAAMTGALAAGEDAAFAAQALMSFDLALGGVSVAMQRAELDLTGSNAEYHCRYALLRAELHRLDGNRAAALASLDLAATLARDDGLTAELALWLAVLDRYFGRTQPRPDIGAAFAAETESWPAIAWNILQGAGGRADLETALGKLPWTQRAENLAIFDRLQGLLAEREGDYDRARDAFRRAQAEPHTRWCADYHLAGEALRKLKIEEA